MPRAPASRAQLRRALINPRASLFCLLIVIISAWMLPAWHPRRDSHASYVYQKLAIRFLHRARPHGGSQNPRVIVERTPEQWTVHTPDADSGWDSLAEILATRPEDLAEMTLVRGSRQHGLWALTRQTDYAHLRETPFGDPPNFTPKDLARARAAACSEFLRQGWLSESQAANLSRADISTGRILWSGWIHNAITLAAMLGLVVSLRWLPSTLRQRSEARRKRRSAQGLCPSCNYPLAGLNAPVCPECGKALTDPHTPHSG